MQKILPEILAISIENSLLLIQRCRSPTSKGPEGLSQVVFVKQGIISKLRTSESATHIIGPPLLIRRNSYFLIGKCDKSLNKYCQICARDSISRMKPYQLCIGFLGNFCGKFLSQTNRGNFVVFNINVYHRQAANNHSGLGQVGTCYAFLCLVSIGI